MSASVFDLQNKRLHEIKICQGFYFYHYYSIPGRSEHYMFSSIRRPPAGRLVFSAKPQPKLSRTFLTSCPKRLKTKLQTSYLAVSTVLNQIAPFFVLCWDLSELPTTKRKMGTFSWRRKETEAKWGVCAGNHCLSNHKL